MKYFPPLTLLLIFCCCSTQTPWQLDTVGSDLPAFSSRKLIYQSPDPLSGTNLELVYFQGEIFGYLTSHSRRLSSANTVSAALCIDTQRYDATLDLHQGNMRVRLPETWTMKAVEALQEGQKISITLDDTTQTVDPTQFSAFYQKLVEGDFGLLQFVQGRER